MDDFLHIPIICSQFLSSTLEPSVTQSIFPAIWTRGWPDLWSISQSEALLGEIAKKIDEIRTLSAGRSHMARKLIVKAPLIILVCMSGCLLSDIKAMRLTWIDQQTDGGSRKKVDENVAIETLKLVNILWTHSYAPFPLLVFLYSSNVGHRVSEVQQLPPVANG